jgi:L-gulonate 3-dehydrogenase
MQKIAVVGGGLIGQGWAVVFAQSGYEVAIYDPSADVRKTVRNTIKQRISDLVSAELVTAFLGEKMLEQLNVAHSLEEAVDGVIYVQENGPEQIEIKKKLTAELDAFVSPDVPIGSSTSGISASRYCEELSGRHRCLVVHPINPPHLIPAVEIVPSPWTEKSIVTKVDEIMRNCSRETILLNKEIDGFVVNRLQGALLEEAFRLVGSGIVSAADLDKAISDGLGLRWSFMGPMKTIHLNAPEGVSDYVERYDGMYQGFDLYADTDNSWHCVTRETLAAELEAAIPIDDIPAAQADRDKKLMALLKHKQQN